MYFNAPYLMQIFTKEADVIAFGVQYSKIDSLFYFALGLSHMGAAILRGAGRTKAPMMIFLFDWCLFRITYITILVRFIPDIRTVISAYPVTWMISAILMMSIVLKGDWLKKNVL
jgi:Na+-driven multidrug efflux pump